MPSKGTRYTKEIERLRAKGLSDARIAEKLSIGRSVVTRNLSESRTQRRLAALVMQAGLYSLKQVLVSSEVAWRHIEGERLRQLEGKSTLTASDVGTLLRNQERALHLAKAFLGKNFSPADVAKAEKMSSALLRAQETLRELEAEGRVVNED